jgi:hypothetical protein
MRFSGVRFEISRYRKRSKKILKLAVFGVQVAALLIARSAEDRIQETEGGGGKHISMCVYAYILMP